MRQALFSALFSALVPPSAEPHHFDEQPADEECAAYPQERDGPVAEMGRSRGHGDRLDLDWPGSQRASTEVVHPCLDRLDARRREGELDAA